MNYKLYYIIEKLFRFFPPESDKTIFIFGGPRSGSTILMEIIAEYPGFYAIGEPLYEKRYKEVSKLNLIGRLQLSADQENKPVETVIKNILSRNTRNEIPSFYPNNLKTVLRLIFARKQVVKFVRASRSVDWVLKRFPHRCAFFIIRNPLSVVSSQIRNNISALFPDNAVPNAIQLGKETRENKNLTYEQRSKLGDYVANLTEPCELYAALWCLDNLEILRSKVGAHYLIVPYEKLITEPDMVLSRITKSMCYNKVPQNALKTLKRPSSSTFRINEFDRSVTSSSFKKYLNYNEIKKVLKIVNYYGFTGYDEQGGVIKDRWFLRKHPNLIF